MTRAMHDTAWNGMAQYDLACSNAVKSDSMQFVSVCGTVQYNATQYALARNSLEQYHLACSICSKVGSSAAKHDCGTVALFGMVWYASERGVAIFGVV